MLMLSRLFKIHFQRFLIKRKELYSASYYWQDLVAPLVVYRHILVISFTSNIYTNEAFSHCAFLPTLHVARSKIASTGMAL